MRDQVGELAIRAPFVGMTQSFWNDRERYLESYWQQIPGVWVHGDLVLRTADGVLFVLGRSDDTLKIAGKRVGPAEIEDLLLGMAEIAEAAAIGIADAVKGQSLVVLVVPSATGALAASLEAAVSARIADQLGRPFRPGRVHVVAQLPRPRSAKVMRRVIRRTYVGQDPGAGIMMLSFRLLTRLRSISLMKKSDLRSSGLRCATRLLCTAINTAIKP